MPILPLEPFLHPIDLFAGPAPHAEEHRWWALHTRPRAEKALARHLLRDETAFFLPLGRKIARVGTRTQTSHLPLFPGYIFLWGDERARVEALTSNLIVRCLPVPDQAVLYADLAGVHRLMTTEREIGAELGLPPGTAVEIVAGPLAGLRGKVVRAEKRLKFVVEVHFLHQGAWVEIDGWMLEKAG